MPREAAVGADCPECGAKLPKKANAGCRECSWKPEGAEEARAGNYREIGPRRCAVHGAKLAGEATGAGWCSPGSGFAVAYTVPVIASWPSGREERVLLTRRTDCPFACPLCARPLTWDGGCDGAHGGCYGSRTPGDRATWTYPGDRYEDAGDGHYRLVAAGPRPIATEAEVQDTLRALRRLAVAIAKRAVILAPRAVDAHAEPGEVAVP